MSKYGVFPSPYFPVLELNTDAGKYGPEETPYLDTSRSYSFLIKLESIVSIFLGQTLL